MDFASAWTARRGQSPVAGRIRCVGVRRAASPQPARAAAPPTRFFSISNPQTPHGGDRPWFLAKQKASARARVWWWMRGAPAAACAATNRRATRAVLCCSYLGYGLMAARAKVLETAKGAAGHPCYGKVRQTPCCRRCVAFVMCGRCPARQQGKDAGRRHGGRRGATHERSEPPCGCPHALMRALMQGSESTYKYAGKEYAIRPAAGGSPDFKTCARTVTESLQVQLACGRKAPQVRPAHLRCHGSGREREGAGLLLAVEQCSRRRRCGAPQVRGRRCHATLLVARISAGAWGQARGLR